MGGKRLTYRDLNAEANRLAHFLREQGIGPERVVGVYLERSVEMVVALLAILKAGGVYLPLDPKFPTDRLAFMLSDAEVPVLLTQAAKRASLPATEARIVLLDELDATLANYPAINPAPANTTEDLAYLIYTSGSTGNPKGVMVPHAALVNFLCSMVERPGMNATDRLLAVTTISFDISILELLLPLITGAHLTIATREQGADANELKRLLAEHNITFMQATPTTWRMLVERGWPGKKDLKILCGGEALTPDLAELLLPRCAELWNMYGPTETTIWSASERIASAEDISLGSPIANTQFYVVGASLQPVPAGSSGELLIGGAGLARGYLKRPELTSEKFIAGTFRDVQGARLYRTGDEVRLRLDGTLEFLGRLDHQVKLNGFRIELGEIECALSKIDGIRQAVVIVREDQPGDKRLVAYYTGQADLDYSALAQSLRTTLPEYMVPALFVRLEEFPKTPNAKLDRKALPAPSMKRPLLAQDYIAPRRDLEKRLAALWCELLRLDEIGIDDSFFDLGGNSLAAVRMVSTYHRRFGREIPPVKVFQYPTIARLCRYLEPDSEHSSFVADSEKRASLRRSRQLANHPADDAIAIIGMVGRFPGADNLDQLWSNLCNGVESISFFKPEELGPGLDESLRTDPTYIRARGIIEGAELFDAAFFGVRPLEAKVMDPQQRVFLELAYNALENAGYDPERYRGLIGVYAGIGDNHYYTTNLLTRPDLMAMAGKLAVEYGNQKDYVALRTAYLLDLRGPAVSLNTACSTTLLAADQACRGLLDYECDLALAGGVDITIPQKSGFPYMEGGTFAKDGHCRPFDAEATGTMFCDGAGVVVLKRLTDAIADGDTIYAVWKGSAKNNNGARPASFLAPSVDGQAEAISSAQARANVDVETIGYIEAHGTGTPIGDPIEVEALRKVFERKTQKKQFCYIGSIKGNIGHPTNAAGVAGLIKAAMVLHHEEIPATLHYRKPNPKIDFANSPFIVADRLIPFPRRNTPRRTAVSSFGFGGTNVHVVLEEAPLHQTDSKSRPLQLVPLSARTPSALESYGRIFAGHFEGANGCDFADAAFTLQTGRKQMAHRRFVVARDPEEAATLLQQPNPLFCGSKRCERRDPPVVFLFGGQGTQYVNMGQNLYQGEPLFRAIVDNCCEILKPHLGRDLRELLYPQSGDEETARISLRDTFYTQPSLFVIQYALARFWQSLGIEPSMMAGHSIGEFVAATLADVWELEDALRVIALRGRLMQNLAPGTMMAVRIGAGEIANFLVPSVQIASNNAPSLCVVSGPTPDVASLRARLEAENIACQPLHTSHAFHSAMMEPMVEPLQTEIAKVKLRGPSRPFVSTVTGRLVTEEETTNSAYWAHHARATVEFSEAVLTLKEMGYDLFLECGPRSTLCTLTRQHFGADRSCVAIPTLADTHESDREWSSLLFAMGSLWLNGVSIDWEAFYTNEYRRRIPLPTYPFERQRYWVDPAPAAVQTTEAVPVVVAPQFTAVGAAVERADAAATESRKNRTLEKLLDILVAVSGRERTEISTTATFLEQGFDSLALAQVVFAIQKDFGIKFSFSKLMNQLPNAEMVAAQLDSAENANQPDEPATAGPAAPRERAAGRNDERDGIPVPAGIVSEITTVPQRGIFVSARLSPNLSVSYNESMTVRIKGKASVSKLKRSLERLVERHDALRASFDESGSWMRILPGLPREVAIVDLTPVRGEPEREKVLQRVAKEEAARPFALPGGPLFRSLIAVMGSDSAAAIFTGHHLICDGWSLDVLVHDLCAFYSEEVSGTSAGLEPAPAFATYVNEVVLREHSPEFSAAREYWGQRFAGGFPALMLPPDFPRSKGREYHAKRLDRTIDATLVAKLRTLAAAQSCSFFTVILGAVSILLARVSKQRRFVLALPIAEQPIVGQLDLVGHCVSLMPFLVDLREKESVRSYLARVQSELGSAQEHSSFTLVSLLENLRLASRVPGVSPISAGLTSVKKFRPDELPHRGFDVDYEANPKTCESFEWYLNAIESNESLELHCHYDVELLREETARDWLATLETILGEIAVDPTADVLELAKLKNVRKAPTEDVLFRHSPRREGPADRDESLDLPSCITEPVLCVVPAEEQESVIFGALLTLWQHVLDNPGVRGDDDFFALGGHSMLAAQLFALIERELGITAPLAALFDAATPRKLAKVLANRANDEEWRALVPIKRTGEGTPLFLVHGAEGNVLLYRSLASHLSGHPVYGLQSPGLDGRVPADGDFERLARRYVDEIRRIQPKGPYLLGGYCLGGTIALEMARQLMEAGEPIGLMAMIENVNVRSIQWPLPWHLRLINRFLLNPYYHLRNLIDAQEEGLDFFLEKLQVELKRAKVAGRVTWARARRRWKQGSVEGFHHIKVAAVYEKALEEWDIRAYPGEITLFISEPRLAGMSAPLGGWEKIARGGVRAHTLPCYPKGSLIEPYVGQLAELLRDCIDASNTEASRKDAAVAYGD